VCTGFLSAPWADVLHACDGRWWNVYGAQAKAVATGEYWTCDAQTADEHGLNWMPSSEDTGLSLHPNKINTGGNSGYQAVGLAYLWGAAKIVLLGYDSQRTGGKGHFHGEHPEGLPNDPPLAEFARRMIQLGADLRAQGVLVFNASRETAITCFERMPIAEALKEQA
jgi:hypothetical protein